MSSHMAADNPFHHQRYTSERPSAPYEVWLPLRRRPHLSTGSGRQLKLEWPERPWGGFRLNCSTLAHKSEVRRTFVIVKKTLSGKP